MKIDGKTYRLGRTQEVVLRLLAQGAKSCQHLAYDWPSLTEASALTAAGRRVEAELAGADT